MMNKQYNIVGELIKRDIQSLLTPDINEEQTSNKQS
jgi:hypothetical protein